MIFKIFDSCGIFATSRTLCNVFPGGKPVNTAVCRMKGLVYLITEIRVKSSGNGTVQIFTVSRSRFCKTHVMKLGVPGTSGNFQCSAAVRRHDIGNSFLFGGFRIDPLSIVIVGCLGQLLSVPDGPLCHPPASLQGIILGGMQKRFFSAFPEMLC